MRARFLGLYVALALLATVSGAWAQSAPATPATDAQSITTLKEQAIVTVPHPQGRRISNTQ
jgi:hypothetical protein